MAILQHRIPLKGHDDSIEFFTKLLREIKSLSGLNSADVLLNAIYLWQNTYSSNNNNRHKSTAKQRITSSVSRSFYLQLLTSTDIQTKINFELDKLRCDHTLRSILSEDAGIGRHSAEYLLEALIFLLELAVKNGKQNATHKDHHLETGAGAKSGEGQTRLNGVTERKKTTCDARRTNLRSESLPPQVEAYTTRLSWRQKLRQQQLAENKQLREMVRRNAQKYSSSLSSASVVEERPILSRKNANLEEKKVNSWTPMHQEDIRVRRSSMLLADKENSPEVNRKIRSESASRISVPRAQTPLIMKSKLRSKYDLTSPDIPTLTLKQRKAEADRLLEYLLIIPEEARPMPGFEKSMTGAERVREGIDCDQVFENIILGNGTTLKRKDYLQRIGVTHVLNAAEFRGVNVGKEYFCQKGDDFRYMGLRIEDTPQTQICR